MCADACRCVSMRADAVDAVISHTHQTYMLYNVYVSVCVNTLNLDVMQFIVVF